MTLRRAARHERGRSEQIQDLLLTPLLRTAVPVDATRSFTASVSSSFWFLLPFLATLIHFHFIDHHFFFPMAAGGSCWGRRRATKKPAGGLLIRTEPEGNTFSREGRGYIQSHFVLYIIIYLVFIKLGQKS